MKNTLKSLSVISSSIMLTMCLCACGSSSGKGSKSEPPPEPSTNVWTNIFGGTGSDSGSTVRQTSDGGYLIVGTTSSFGAGDSDIYIIKTDAYGKALWEKTFGGTGVDTGTTVYQTSDGGYLIVGTTLSAIAFETDIYLVRTDANWNTLWTKTLIGTKPDGISSVQQTPDGSFLIARTAGLSVNLMKMDTEGNTLWTKTFDVPGIDAVTSLGQTSDGGYIIVGKKREDVSPYEDVSLNRTDGEGKVLWTNTLSFMGCEVRNSVQQTPDGGYIRSGTRVSSCYKGRSQAYILRANSEGNIIWTSSFTGQWQAIGFSMQQTSDGGYILAGATTADTYFWGHENVYLVKTDSSGNSQWERTFGGSEHDWGTSVQQTSDGGYIIVGETNSFSPITSNLDIYLIKTDSEGNTKIN